MSALRAVGKAPVAVRRVASRLFTVRRIALRLLALFVLVYCATHSIDAQEQTNDFAEILALAGWDAEALAQFDHDQPLTDDETAKLLPLLKRLGSFDPLSIARWSTVGVPVADLIAEPGNFQTQLVHLHGTVTGTERQLLSAEDAARLEMPAFYLCDVQINEGDTLATVLALDVPTAWQQADALDEPASFSGLLIKRIAAGDSPRLLFAAPQVAWHPVSVNGVNESFGRAVLGTLGYDVRLLDDVQNRTPIRGQEREAFFQLLYAAGRIGPNQLIRSAQRALPEVADHWRQRPAGNEQERLLAEEVIRQAADGSYSVAPLFNDADRQAGNLVVLDGTVRRAVRVEVGTTPTGEASDVARRFGFDHYYELDLFTADSQNYPIVFCVRELPEGFPTGSKLHEPVRLAGFFFKSWRHHTRQGGAGEGTGQQLAPLLVGPAPLRIDTEAPAASPLASIVGGGLFVLALVAVWIAAWWYGRGDDAFRERTLARQYEVPAGESLDELLATGDDKSTEPDFSEWNAQRRE